MSARQVTAGGEGVITQTDPETIVEIGGVKYTLVYDMCALKEIRKGTGINVLEEGLTPAQMSDPDVFIKVLRAGLLRSHPDVTEDFLDGVVTVSNFMGIVMRLRAALVIGVPQEVLDAVKAMGEGEKSPESVDPPPPETLS